MDATKRCPRCTITKPVHAFHRNAARHDGIDVYCRQCCENIRQQKRAIRLASLPSQAERDKARFWSKVAVGRPNECWLWQGRIINSGYGLFSIGNHAISAHRYAYEIAHGPIPEGRVVRHDCDVKLCQNPSHLRQGTHQDNMNDAVKRDRVVRGVNHPHFGMPCEKTYLHRHPETVQGDNNGRSKLKSEQRDEIISKWAGGKKLGGQSCEALAAQYHVSPSAIRFLVKSQTWRH